MAMVKRDTDSEVEVEDPPTLTATFAATALTAAVSTTAVGATSHATSISTPFSATTIATCSGRGVLTAATEEVVEEEDAERSPPTAPPAKPVHGTHGAVARQLPLLCDPDDNDEETTLQVYWEEAFSYRVSISGLSTVGSVLERVRKEAARDGCASAVGAHPEDDDDWAQLKILGRTVEKSQLYSCDEPLVRGHPNGLFETLRAMSRNEITVTISLNGSRDARRKHPPSLPWFRHRDDMSFAICNPRERKHPGKQYRADSTPWRAVAADSAELRFYLSHSSVKVVAYEVEQAKIERGALDVQWRRVSEPRLAVDVGGTLKRITVKGLEAESEYRFRVRTVGEAGVPPNIRWAVGLTTARTSKAVAKQDGKQDDKQEEATEGGYSSDDGAAASSGAGVAAKRKKPASPRPAAPKAKAPRKQAHPSGASGARAGASGNEPDMLVAKLTKLKKLHDAGLLSVEVYKEEQQKLLNKYRDTL